MNDDVKAVTVDGVSPTVDNIKSGRYGAVRSFSIVTKGTESPSAAQRDFTDFIMSEEGQKIIEEKGYVSILREESGDAAALRARGAYYRFGLIIGRACYGSAERSVH